MARRLAFLLAIRPGTEHLYDEAHEAMTEELRAVYRHAGLRNWTMFRLGTEVVGYAESVHDVEAALEEVAVHPLEKAFNEALADVFVDEQDPRFGMLIMTEVWHND